MKRLQIIFGIIGSVAQMIGLLMIAMTAFAARITVDSPLSLVSEPAVYVGSDACLTCHNAEHNDWSLPLRPIGIEDVVNNPTVMAGALIAGEQDHQVEIASETRPHAAEDVHLMDSQHQRYIMQTNNGFMVFSSHLNSTAFITEDGVINSWFSSCENCHIGASDLELPIDPQVNQICETCHGAGSLQVETAQSANTGVGSGEDGVDDDSS
ncbi:MAG: hypothetical protein U0694_19770 [Anaerolineae bacterium]